MDDAGDGANQRALDNPTLKIVDMYARREFFFIFYDPKKYIPTSFVIVTVVLECFCCLFA